MKRASTTCPGSAAHHYALMRFMLRCARDTLAILPRSSRIQAIPYDIPHDAPHDSRHRKSRIAILAGAGVEHDAAAARLKEIAERWSIPVATTLRAKGVFPEDHALSLGVFGYAGSRHATAALDGELDCLLVLGSGFNERDTMHWTVRERSKAFMIHVNTDMEELTAHGDLGHVVPGSAHAFLDHMHARAAVIAPALAAGESRRREWLATIKAKPRLYDVENSSRATAPIHPTAAVAALRQAFPRDGIVLVDSGAHRAF